jgi:hypothetical protein
MWLQTILLVLVAIIPLHLIFSGTVVWGQDWRTANRESSGIAPDPEKTREAVVQVYAARALNWRGFFGVHTWIATKPENAPVYTVHHVIGWRLWRGLPVVASGPDVPDRIWFGNTPELLAEIKGPEASHAITEILAAVNSYPYAHEYRLWPGPNSNTFTAHVARRVPALKLHLPVTALGKDFPSGSVFWDRAPSATGYQVSLYGLFGILMAAQEGVELNLLGLSFGIDFQRPALKLPLIGRIGWGYEGSSISSDR